MSFDSASLRQSWPAPSHPKPIVTLGAGSIVLDAHFAAAGRLPCEALVRATAVACGWRDTSSRRRAAYATSARHSANAAERLCL
jgi:hypothetical protein